jgi:hypothetical protein
MLCSSEFALWYSTSELYLLQEIAHACKLAASGLLLLIDKHTLGAVEEAG